MALFSVSSLLAFLELLVSFAALITKKLTDSQGEQVYKRNQKLSNEWSLLNNLNWSQAGNDFSILTYGGYTLIAGAFLFSRLIADKYGACEKILLYCGMTFFFIEVLLTIDTTDNALCSRHLTCTCHWESTSALGAINSSSETCLVFATLEYIPMDIQVNALVLGTLSAAGAILFFIDVCYNSSLIKSVSKEAQTETESLFTKDIPSILQKPLIQLKPPHPANVQICHKNDQGCLKPQSMKFKGCYETKAYMQKYLKARVLQTDV